MLWEVHIVSFEIKDNEERVLENNLGFGIKFFREEEHKKLFESGRIFSNPISYYRKHRKELGRGRGDSNEGILTFCSKEKSSATLITEKGQSISCSVAEMSIETVVMLTRKRQ